MGLSYDEVRALMDALENSSIREFEISEENFHLRMSKNEAAPVIAAAPALANNNGAGNNAAAVEEAAVNPLDKVAKPGVAIKAPLVGTVYLKPKPDAAPFKKVGDTVTVGEQVAIIEAMKLMTPVKSEVAGKIVKILVEDEQVVDFDKPLYIVEEG